MGKVVNVNEVNFGLKNELQSLKNKKILLVRDVIETGSGFPEASRKGVVCRMKKKYGLKLDLQNQTNTYWSGCTGCSSCAILSISSL